jgi:hypothetical protein
MTQACLIFALAVPDALVTLVSSYRWGKGFIFSRRCTSVPAFARPRVRIVANYVAPTDNLCHSETACPAHVSASCSTVRGDTEKATHCCCCKWSSSSRLQFGAEKSSSLFQRFNWQLEIGPSRLDLLWTICVKGQGTSLAGGSSWQCLEREPLGARRLNSSCHKRSRVRRSQQKSPTKDKEPRMLPPEAPGLYPPPGTCQTAN